MADTGHCHTDILRGSKGGRVLSTVFISAILFFLRQYCVYILLCKHMLYRSQPQFLTPACDEEVFHGGSRKIIL
jgi:hypothetical protein